MINDLCANANSVIVSENGAYQFNYLLIGFSFDDIMTKYVTWGWIGAGVPYVFNTDMRS